MFNLLAILDEGQLVDDGPISGLNLIGLVVLDQPLGKVFKNPKQVFKLRGNAIFFFVVSRIIEGSRGGIVFHGLGKMSFLLGYLIFVLYDHFDHAVLHCPVLGFAILFLLKLRRPQPFPLAFFSRDPKRDDVGLNSGEGGLWSKGVVFGDAE